MRRARGFTLIEVLVALAVTALTMLAIGGTAALTSDAAAQVAERTLATWVADNELTRARIAGTFPEPGSRSGSATLGGRDWTYSLTVAATEDDDLRRIEVVVQPAGQQRVAALLVGFVPRTPSGTAASTP